MLRTGAGLAMVTAGTGALLTLRKGRALAVTATDNIVLQWNNALLQAIRNTKPGPTIVARALAVLHTCMYGAWTAYDPIATSPLLGGSLRQPKSQQTIANKNTAPSGVSFTAASSANSQANGLTIGDIGPGHVAAVWIRRTGANTVALNNDGVTLEWSGDTTA